MKLTPEIAEYAVRYCITRHTYAFNDGLDIADKFWPLLAASTREDVMKACLDRDHVPTQPRLRHWYIRNLRTPENVEEPT